MFMSPTVHLTSQAPNRQHPPGPSVLCNGSLSFTEQLIHALLQFAEAACSGPFRQPHSGAQKAPRTHSGVTPWPAQPVQQGGNVLAREALQGCHRPARALQLLAVAVAAAAVAAIVGRVSIHLQVLPTRVHVFPRPGHSTSQGPRGTLKSPADYQLCYCVPTTSRQKAQTFRNIFPSATKEGLKISP